MIEKDQESRGAADHAYHDGLWVLKVLEDASFKARFAGGSVRDRLLGQIPNDFDIATNARPEQVCSIFKQKGVKVIPTGIDHGTVTLILKNSSIEVTSLRRDVATDGRRAVVEFGDSFKEDARRRDFTINALYEDRHGKIYDYFGGQEDIKCERLRFVGDARSRIKEDYLRILRLFRFWSRLAFEPEPQTLEVITEEAAGLQKISQERITAELLGILAGKNPIPPLKAMLECSIFEQILVGLKELPIPMLERLLKLKLPEQEKELVLLASLVYVMKPQPDLDEFGNKLRLPKKSVEKLGLILSPSWIFPDPSLTDGELMEWIDHWEQRGGQGYTLKVLVKAWPAIFPEQSPMIEHLKRIEETQGSLRRQAVPLTGHDLNKQLSLSSGPDVGELLRRLKISFRNREWQTAEQGLKLAKSWLRTTAHEKSQDQSK